MATVSHAQYIGIKGGFTLSNLNFEGVNDNNMRPGYNVGAYINLPLGDVFAFQPEVNYTTKGATANYNVLFYNGDYSFNLNYFDIPLMGVLRLGEVAELHFGPYIGFLSNSSLSTDGDFGEGQEKLSRDSFKSMDYGLAGGLAFNFNALQIGARYHYGLQQIADSDAAKLFIGDARHSYLQVYGALRLGVID
jgi:hypothetical protein